MLRVVDEYEMGSHAKLKKIQLQDLHSRGANKTSQKDKAKHVLATLTSAFISRTQFRFRGQYTFLPFLHRSIDILSPGIPVGIYPSESWLRFGPITKNGE